MSAEVHFEPSVEVQLGPDDLLSWEIDYRTLPPGEYPGIAGVAHALPALDDPQNFITAVQLMIEAVRTRAAAAPGT
jgi:hypothetical protein